MPKTVMIEGKEYVLQWDKYMNLRPALSLMDPSTGSIYTRCTVNIHEADLEEDEVCVKDYGENEGLLKILVEQEIVSIPVRHVPSGHVDVPVCKLLVSP